MDIIHEQKEGCTYMNLGDSHGVGTPAMSVKLSARLHGSPGTPGTRRRETERRRKRLRWWHDGDPLVNIQKTSKNY